jgi:hypothetical protein
MTMFRSDITTGRDNNGLSKRAGKILSISANREFGVIARRQERSNAIACSSSQS